MHDLLAITFNKPSGSNEARNMLSVIRHLGKHGSERVKKPWLYRTVAGLNYVHVDYNTV